MWKVVLADDQQLVRKAFRALLEDESDIIIVAEACDGFGAVETTNRLKPDILITDLKMPGIDGIEVIKRVRETSPDTYIIILSMFGARTYVQAALKAGANGYVLKKYGADGLIDAIRTIAKGSKYLSPTLPNTNGY